MSLTLTRIPGFADLGDRSLLQDTPALGVYLAKIENNAAFGMVRCEIFVGYLLNGQAMPLPISPVDGYQYQQNELMFLWGVQSSLNPNTGWITGPDCLWYGGWNIAQATGAAATEEWYRRSGSGHPNPAQSNDGSFQVFVVGQRQKANLTIATQVTAYTDVADSALAVDSPLSQGTIQQLNDNSKFPAVAAEVIYMGEFTNGQTVPQAVSPADGYTYARAQTKLFACWRWTTDGSGFTQPINSNGQLGPMIWSINASTGVITITIKMIDNSGNLITVSGYGRMAVFAFCSRQNLVTLPGLANDFAEIDVDNQFVSGATLRSSVVTQMNHNIREATLATEFFGPADYTNGNTVPLPVSPVDGYTYSRAECAYVYEWADTTNATGTHLRVVGWAGKVDQNTGAVQTVVWRLPPGGPVVVGSGGNELLRVITVAKRGGHAQSTSANTGSAPSDIGSIVTENDPATTAPYVIWIDFGDSNAPGVTVDTDHVIPGDLVASVTLPSGLTGSSFKCRVAPAGTYTWTLKKNGSSIGTIAFAASTTGTATFSSTVTFSPGDVFTLTSAATPDGSGYYFTFAGERPV